MCVRILSHIRIAVLCSLTLLFLGCQDTRSEVTFFSPGDSIVTLQSARALIRFTSETHPQYTFSIQNYSSQEQVLDMLSLTPNSFALLDASTLASADDYVNATQLLDIRSLFAVYHNFLYILVDAIQLIDEEQPQINDSILFYNSSQNPILQDVGVRIFSALGADVQTIPTIDTDTINLLHQGRAGAILFFAPYPSSLILDNVLAQDYVRLLSLPQAFIRNMIGTAEYLNAQTLPVQAYPNLVNGDPVLTVQTPTILVTNNKTDAQLILDVCDSFIINFDEYRTLYPQFNSLTLGNLREGLGIEQHVVINDCISSRIVLQ